jgi:hypothetical protein
MKLRPYQREIVERGTEVLLSHSILYLAMEVRTGKTITALSIAQKVKALNVLFVTRKKAMTSIEKDYEAVKFPFELDLINYESLHKLTTEEIEEFDLVICDEAHCLGAFPLPSERTKQLRNIVGNRLLILLSGTPTPESWSQLYHQLYISAHTPWKQFRNFYAWAKDFVTVKKRYIYNREINDYTNADREKIERDTKHLFISFTQEEAGFEQMVEEEVIKVYMLNKTYTAADRLRKDKVLRTSEGIVVADTAVKVMSKLQQIYSGTVIVDETESGESTAQIFDVTKAEHICDKFAGQKIAIFYKFKAEEMAIRSVFGTRVVDTPESFNMSGENAVYISQIQSGREGINLSSADCLVMYNIDFSAVSYWQARARLQSKDRTKPAKVYWVFAIGGIESKIYKRVKDKKDYTLHHFKKDFNITSQS